MRSIAFNALNYLALDIAHGAYIWPLADRIERRFKLSGYTLQRLNRLAQLKADFLAQQCAKHDALNPNRLSYLHR